ncbi:MAG: Rrf2 family transcriptional regulator, partial [bacterium]
MLKMTKTQEQAVRLSLRLADSACQQTLSELAAQETLPEPMVAKLLGQLRRGGVVTAVRGRHGGYNLAGSPAKVSVAAILRAIGGEPAPEPPCVTAPEKVDNCPRVDDCGLRSVLRHLQIQVTHLLDNTSLEDLLHAETRVDQHVHELWPPEQAA